jgi:radical SAM superfamily enzyme YgiQ (UPF0313 family)
LQILLIIPPFTQLNTAYPATAYLKGYVQTLGYKAHQADLSIEVILALFSRAGLTDVFARATNYDGTLSEQAARVLRLKDSYLRTIEPVISFLQHKNPTLALQICSRKYLPEAGRFAQTEDLEWAFGSMGTHDLARHLATLYLEDLGDLVTEAIDTHFGFSRYAERLARTATHFDGIHAELQAPDSLISDLLMRRLASKLTATLPDVVCITVPFPGNLFSALKIGQYIKKHHPNTKVILGGGYANTELRSVSDERLFEYIDFLTLDDGEAPLQILLEHLEGKRAKNTLKRVFCLQNGVVSYLNGAPEKDVAQRDTGTPDYSDLPLHDYLSVIEVVNPMHRLWSDGRWNKLTLAHGCYWGKCSFCDISLDYIKNYEPINAELLCDRIETIIAQTGQNGFHFVDEAAPPALMRDLAIEIIRRQLTVVWWTNIRFEKSFTLDLCLLLKASGCIAVSGGLEVASDRLLEKMKKGVTVAQVASVADAFTQSGIMVHAYLMYGFPTQTPQETINSLEMVRQLFEQGVIQSGFWHQFAMTSHSPVGLDPKAFQVERIGPEVGPFADNDLYHDDPIGGDHDRYSEGLKKSLFNYMHGVGFQLKLSKWFDFKVPNTQISPDFIEKALENNTDTVRSNAMVIWLGQIPEIKILSAQSQVCELVFHGDQDTQTVLVENEQAIWWQEMMHKLKVNSSAPLHYQDFQKTYSEAGYGKLEYAQVWRELREVGLVLV